MKTRKILALLLSLVMVLSLCGNAFAAHLNDDVTELETENSDLSVMLATQGMALLENNGVLPLKDTGDKKVAVFGAGAQFTIKGGAGSGDVNQRERDCVYEAFEAAGWTVTNPTWIAKMTESPVTGNSRTGGEKKVDLEITDEELAEAMDADLCLYVLARSAGEFVDRTSPPVPGDGDYYLTELELANFQKINDNFDRVIVVLNATVVDTTWMKDFDNVDAVFYMLQGGQRGGEALEKILTGEVTPSGKITDTFPINYSDYADAEYFSLSDGNTVNEWYYDGIYVGYRYFDTFGVDVAYPFGYGLSYTDFEINVQSVTADVDEVKVEVEVANVGAEYSGKEVVQVYFSAPDGALEKPYQELAAYGKTDELEPGQKQTLTISFATADMSSYSEELAAYVMEAGEYIIRVGNSSRNTVAAAKIVLDADVITEQLSNQLALEDGVVLDELSKEGATPIANNDAEELADVEPIELKAADFPEAPNNASPLDDETMTTYLFADDAANYTARTGITLHTKTVPGIIQNAANPDGDGGAPDTSKYAQARGDITYNGYQDTTYDEVVEIVPDLPEGITKETAKLTDVFEGTITLEQFLACLSVEELARIAIGGASGVVQADSDNPVIGAEASSVQGGAGQTNDAYYLTRHIPSMPNADGPAGIRITQHYYKTNDGAVYQARENTFNSLTQSTTAGYIDAGYTDDDVTEYYQFCTAFPAGNLMAMTWDPDLIYEEGVAIGKEMVEYGVTTWLAPGMNIHKNAVCGRNFEYYSEDPLVTGLCAACVTAGVQSNPGIGVTLKHCWGNNQENNRNSVNNIISERASREIYLKGFEICVKMSQPMCIMNSYNENNGWPASDSYDLNEDLFRGEWGFGGAVMTDWGGGQSTPIVSMHAGCDMIMPGRAATNLPLLINAVGTQEPTFNEDGSIADQGDFVFDAAQGEPPTIEVTTTAKSNSELPESVQEAIEAGYAKFWIRGTQGYVGWYGHNDEVNNICIGDLQKSAKHILGNALVSQDMVKLYADLLGEEVDVTPITELREGTYGSKAMVVKGEITAIPAIVAEKDVEVNTAESDTVDVAFTFTGDEALTTARFNIKCDVPFAFEVSDTGEKLGVYTTDNDIEFNVDTGDIIVYMVDGSVISSDLFTLTFDVSAVEESGEYPIEITVLDCTDADGARTAVQSVAGSIIVEVGFKPGDVNMDGSVDNRDIIMLARYLVHLVDFNEAQELLADVNEDGVINNSDLVALSRSLVE